jgi:uncharacterized protein (TIGR02453 family)
MDTFTGIPHEALRFYSELEENNNREWWLEHKNVYESAVKEPLMLLLAELEDDFGPGKLFRPYRDIRFSKDKSPYNTHQGAFAGKKEGKGFYLQLSGDGLLVGGGCHIQSPAQITHYRAAVDAPESGGELQEIVDQVSAAGFEVEGEKLKTVPRGFDSQHPRAELLKHKSLSAAMTLGEPDWLSTPAAAKEIGGRWEKLRPLVDWMNEHAAP